MIDRHANPKARDVAEYSAVSEFNAGNRPAPDATDHAASQNGLITPKQTIAARSTCPQPGGHFVHVDLEAAGIGGIALGAGGAVVTAGLLPQSRQWQLRKMMATSSSLMPL
jgi:hypothetical protein